MAVAPYRPNFTRRVHAITDATGLPAGRRTAAPDGDVHDETFDRERRESAISGEWHLEDFQVREDRHGVVPFRPVQ